MLIKVCGITNLKDALAAVVYGANALGFIRFPQSPRFVSYKTITDIIKHLPEGIAKVGVFVKGWTDDVREELFDIIQLYGFVEEKELPPFRKRVLVAVGLDGLERFPRHEIIVDESRGSGRRADWSALSQVKRKFLLSGGLEPSNIRQALESLQPAGIDTCSGVEAGPGIKDHCKLRNFLETATAFSGKRDLDNEQL